MVLLVVVLKPDFWDLSSLDATVFVADAHNGFGEDIVIHRLGQGDAAGLGFQIDLGVFHPGDGL